MQAPAAAAPPAAAPGPALSFNRYGPFYRAQHRLGLLDDQRLRAARRALLFAALAWLPALVLAWAQGLALNVNHQTALLFDFSAYAYVLAIAAFVLMEQASDTRMAYLMRQFIAHGLMPQASQVRYRAAQEAMARRTGSALAEAVLLLLAYALSYLLLSRGAAQAEGARWFGQQMQGSLHLSWAGWWALLVLMPLFWFLLGRWLWRFFVWGRLLRDLAGCDLQLVATHPDRCGGLAFIGQYPGTYLLFVFALSTVVSAGVLKHVVYGGASLASFKFAALGVLLFLLICFVLPLLAFAPVLKRLKRHGLSIYGALISRHNRAFERKWCTLPDAGDELLGSPDASSLADIGAAYEQVKNILPLPLTKEGLLPLLLAALLPMIVVAATQAPVQDILAWVKKLLLF